MKINEFAKLPDNKFDFDIVDDATMFMKNDHDFYRKDYFPMMSKMADLHTAGKTINPRKLLAPLVDKGITQYCKKFNLGRSPDDVFKQPDREAVIDKLFSDEMEQIKKGEYK